MFPDYFVNDVPDRSGAEAPGHEAGRVGCCAELAGPLRADLNLCSPEFFSLGHQKLARAHIDSARAYRSARESRCRCTALLMRQRGRPCIRSSPRSTRCSLDLERVSQIRESSPTDSLRMCRQCFRPAQRSFTVPRDGWKPEKAERPTQNGLRRRRCLRHQQSRRDRASSPKRRTRRPENSLST